MVIAIGTYGDGVCAIGTIRSTTIGANGSPLAPFLSPLAQMAPMAISISKRNDPFTDDYFVLPLKSLVK